MYYSLTFIIYNIESEIKYEYIKLTRKSMILFPPSGVLPEIVSIPPPNQKSKIPTAYITLSDDGEIVCSVEETNRIRKILGMKPLIINEEDKLKRDNLHCRTLINEDGELYSTVCETNRIRRYYGMRPLDIQNTKQ